MRMLSRTLFIAVMLLLTGAAAASAADQCFGDNLGNVYVAKGFTLPPVNNCKTFNGFLNGLYYPVFGNVCKSNNNLYYIFNLQYSAGASYVSFSTFYLDPGTLSGSGVLLGPDYGSGGSSLPFNISKVLCPAIRRFGP